MVTKGFHFLIPNFFEFYLKDSGNSIENLKFIDIFNFFEITVRI